MAKDERGSLSSWLQAKMDLSSLADSLSTSAATSRTSTRVNSVALALRNPTKSDTQELQQTDGPSHGVSEAMLNPVAPVFSPRTQPQSSPVSRDGPGLRGGGTLRATNVERAMPTIPGKSSLLCRVQFWSRRVMDLFVQLLVISSSRTARVTTVEQARRLHIHFPPSCAALCPKTLLTLVSPPSSTRNSSSSFPSSTSQSSSNLCSSLHSTFQLLDSQPLPATVTSCGH